MSPRPFATCMAFALLLLGSGCAGELTEAEIAALSSRAGIDAGTTPTVTCPSVKTICATSGCHDSKTKLSGLDLSGDLAPYIDKPVDVPTDPSLAAGTCAEGSANTYRIIDRSNAEQSLLYLKTTASPCGEKMPLTNRTKWKPADSACLLALIKSLPGVKSGASSTATDAGVD